MAITFCLSFKDSADTRISQLSHALNAAQASNASQISGINSQISSINDQISPLNGFGQYDMTCSTDLTGQNGPAQFDFPCMQHK